MVRKLCLLILVMSLFISSANAAFYGWTGAALNGLWNDPLNWDQFEAPPYASGDVGLNASGISNGSIITIPEGFDASCAFGNLPYGTIFGPEFGMSLTIKGKLDYPWYMAPVANNPVGWSSVSMVGNASTSGEGLAVGSTWWYQGGPYVNVNMYDNAYAKYNYIWWGGHIHMYGGTMDISGGVTALTEGAVSDATRLIDITKGKLILPDAFTATVQDWIARGILLAYGNTPGTNGYDIVIDTMSMPGRTIVTATPEPTTIALLGLGALALIRRKRS